MPQFFRRIQHTTTCLLTLLAMLPFSYAYAGEFTVTDGKADAEISEVSRIYLDGKLVSVIRLNDKNQEKTVKITTPMGRLDHTYTLCGEITIRSPEGRVETHEVDSDGTLHNPDGHHFYALGSDNFTEFFLTDPNAPEAAEHHPGRSGVCAAPIS
ncbi:MULTISPECIES: hypothetical protein [Acetobacter]|uniref:hypothetical protein n=1 Tax=Acetobacter TaxID=434 RepID=UPI000676D3AB|nr:hypothetical protein [Acetobacter pasteurianus]AKR49141.1 hypothetical protein DB34_09645 [Acetobacter pasteurianus]